MRHLVLTAAIAVIASPALASSITRLESGGSTKSVVTITCTTCEAVAEKEPEGPGVYHVPTLGPDIQTTEIRDIGGQQKLVRTECWWGGSPVTFVSKMPEWLTTEAQKADATQPVRSGPVNTARILPPVAPDGVDADATTAAVGAPDANQNDANQEGAGQNREAADKASGNPQDFDGFRLRQP
ncbi:plant virulence effector HPE1-like domain-containing protein [Neorhizobium sp. NPDC001467]|uniref:plant virulence effector HPE1-like domain-containing protein n=1 Tax=Neorhizobium sp. NPDC001467 TaxID=3390595 RepID=UPI003CFC3E23